MVTPLHNGRGDEHSPVDMFLRMRRQRVHGHSSERPGMHDNAEAEQNSLAQAEERTRCAGLQRDGRRGGQHAITDPHTLQGLAAAVGAVVGLGELISKAPRDPSRISQN